MTARVARALLVARLDRLERPVIIALVAAARPLAERDVVARAAQFGGLKARRYRRAVLRLLREGVLAEDELGRLVIAEPDRRVCRISLATLVAIDAMDRSRRLAGARRGALDAPRRSGRGCTRLHRGSPPTASPAISAAKPEVIPGDDHMEGRSGSRPPSVSRLPISPTGRDTCSS